jgi:hypothetical protein
VLAVDLAQIQSPALAVEADPHRFRQVLRDGEVVREQVGGTGRHDGDRRIRTGESVDTALYHPVAAPHEQELGTLRQRPAGLLRRLLALRHLVPEQVLHAMLGDQRP